MPSFHSVATSSLLTQATSLAGAVHQTFRVLCLAYFPLVLVQQHLLRVLFF